MLDTDSINYAFAKDPEVEELYHSFVSLSRDVDSNEDSSFSKPTGRIISANFDRREEERLAHLNTEVERALEDWADSLYYKHSYEPTANPSEQIVCSDDLRTIFIDVVQSNFKVLSVMKQSEEFHISSDTVPSSQEMSEELISHITHLCSDLKNKASKNITEITECLTTWDRGLLDAFPELLNLHSEELSSMKKTLYKLEEDYRLNFSATNSDGQSSWVHDESILERLNHKYIEMQINRIYNQIINNVEQYLIPGKRIEQIANDILKTELEEEMAQKISLILVADNHLNQNISATKDIRDKYFYIKSIVIDEDKYLEYKSSNENNLETLIST